MKYLIQTYGCQMNTADSEEMAQPLKARGLVATNDSAEADVILMNTCTVRDNAEHKADSQIGRLRVWKEVNPERILIIAGCAASQWGESIKKKYAFIDLVAPATKIDQFPELVAKVLGERFRFEDEERLWRGGDVEVLSDTPQPLHLSTPPPSSPSRFGTTRTGYVTIMRGCNYSCSYCIVPKVRGREVYRPMEAILTDVQDKIAAGFSEIMLLGQTVNSYNYRGDVERLSGRGVPARQNPSTPPPLHPSTAVTFSGLLRAVADVPGVKTLRFMSPHPRHFKDDQIQAMVDHPTIARHVHLPLQSGSDRVLERMKRLYTRDEYREIVRKLRAAMPGIEITTDVIVGFPGETETDFEATLSLLREIDFDSVFAFQYSPRPGTPAAAGPDDISPVTKEERIQRVLALVLPPKAKAV